jgi:hypothetical protein
MAKILILHIKLPLTHLSLIDLKKKNPFWDRNSVDDYGLTSRALFTEENTNGEC